MSEFDYDLFVIGGGSGGVRAARVAASEAGAKVALAEEDRYGGTCVIRGCVPKKLMVFASGYGDLANEAASYGWDITTGPFDWTAFSKRLNRSSRDVSRAINENTQQNFSEYINGYRIKRAKRLLIDKEYRLEKIATVAYDCGFGNVTSFNLAFKSATQLTPSQYRKKNT